MNSLSRLFAARPVGQQPRRRAQIRRNVRPGEIGLAIPRAWDTSGVSTNAAVGNAPVAGAQDAPAPAVPSLAADAVASW